jgi:hypothetical protein
MSNAQKIQMVKYALEGALYNKNEVREWFGDEPISGGDVYQISKNYTENVTENNKEGNDDGQAGQTDPADAVPEGNESA